MKIFDYARGFFGRERPGLPVPTDAPITEGQRLWIAAEAASAVLTGIRAEEVYTADWPERYREAREAERVAWDAVRDHHIRQGKAA